MVSFVRICEQNEGIVFIRRTFCLLISIKKNWVRDGELDPYRLFFMIFHSSEIYANIRLYDFNSTLTKQDLEFRCIRIFLFCVLSQMMCAQSMVIS